MAYFGREAYLHCLINMALVEVSGQFHFGEWVAVTH